MKKVECFLYLDEEKLALGGILEPAFSSYKPISWCEEINLRCIKLYADSKTDMELILNWIFNEE